MALTITRAESRDEIDAVFNGDAPHYHPDEFWDTRINEKRVFIAKNDNDNIGLLSYTIWWGNCPFLELVHIQDSFQRQGIARKLLKEAALDIKSKTFEKLVSSCEIFNNDSLLFHKALGFKKLKSLDLPHGEEQFFSIELEQLL
ncbi:MAG: GNAT family N-acetyltransferase [Alphaproteobacteria bacterium]|nr:GNAT family N-acetyltransferase [Alphaproteobacteria bacterium]